VVGFCVLRARYDFLWRFDFLKVVAGKFLRLFVFRVLVRILGKQKSRKLFSYKMRAVTPPGSLLLLASRCHDCHHHHDHRRRRRLGNKTNAVAGFGKGKRTRGRRGAPRAALSKRGGEEEEECLTRKKDTEKNDDEDDERRSVTRRRRRIKCVIVPGFLRGFESYDEMRENVEIAVRERFYGGVDGDDDCEIEVCVAKVEKAFWIPVTFRGESLRKILDAIEDAVVCSAGGDEDDEKIILIGHSAGGWIARLFLGGKSIKYDGKLYDGYRRAKNVVALVTLGTPHNSAEAYPFGRVKEKRTRCDDNNDDDETSLQETRRLYPNCFLKADGMKYVTVQGTGFRGRPFKFTDFIPSSSTTTDWKTLLGEIKHGISYKTDCLDPSSDGDSVTCESSGHGLAEAVQVSIEGVKHEKDDIYPWYGSLDVVRTWMRAVLEML